VGWPVDRSSSVI